MFETLTYVAPDGLKLPLRCRRKDGDVWFHLRDLRGCLGVVKQSIIFEVSSVGTFNGETHINMQGVKRLFNACAEFELSQHFIGWFYETVLGRRSLGNEQSG